LSVSDLPQVHVVVIKKGDGNSSPRFSSHRFVTGHMPPAVKAPCGPHASLLTCKLDKDALLTSEFVDIVLTVPVSKSKPKIQKAARVERVVGVHCHGDGFARCLLCCQGILDDREERSDSCDKLDSSEEKDNRYKTELCRNWEEYGRCPYGKKCLFAHGADELRSLRRNPLFKTSPCYWFYKVGICNHGKRCVFAHHPPFFDEAKEEVPEVELDRNHRLPVFAALTTFCKLLEERVRVGPMAMRSC